MKLKLCVLLLLLTTVLPLSAQSRAVTYQNCTELHKVYKGGVARVGAKNKGGKTRYKPFENNELYEANKKSDRDKDGIACER